MLVSLILFFILIISFFVNFFSNVALLGISMISACILVFIILSTLNLFWYGLIFLLINVGGSMVLFYYMFSLQSNPVSSFYLFLFFFFSFSIFFFLNYVVSLNSINIFSELLLNISHMEEVSFYLFSLIESNFLVFLSLFLIFVLLVVSMMTSIIGGSFRYLLI
uniref:NADH dehydrogenase subunit 6 n=1 Tax=Vermiviatum covidum TaxID=3348911 RepID=A0A8K1XU71_9PLAT|nr:NADH dehydrogenase subunit 6 [Humbertium sp. MNHN JL351]